MLISKKKQIFGILFSCFLITRVASAYSYEDYELYLQAKEAYEAKDYQQAEKEFLQVKRVFPYSLTNRQKLVDFYLGLSQFHLGKKQEALPLLLKNVVPGKEEERDFYLSQIYLEQGENKQAIFYSDRLLSSKYSYTHHQREQETEPILRALDSYYDSYFQAKFSKDFSQISALKTTDILEIVHYLSSQGEDKESQNLILACLKEREGKESNLSPFYEALFESLFRTKDYAKIIQYADLFLRTAEDRKENADFYHLQKARAYHHQKNYLQSLFLYQEIKNPRYMGEAKSELASIQYFFENYEKVIELLATKTPKSSQDWKLLGNSYFALEREEEFLSVAKKLQEKSPSAYENIFYQFLINHPEVPFDEINSLLFINIIVDAYLNNLYHFDFQDWNKSNSLEYEKLLSLKEIQDLDLLELELKNSQFHTIFSIENASFVSTFYEKHGFYEKAFQNSFAHIHEFGKYQNLIFFVFPRYYHDLIQKFSFEYSIPDEILNTLILLSSQWDTNYEQTNKMGLFALDYHSHRNPLELKNPEVSLEIACKKIKKIREKYPQDFQTMIVFLYGEAFLKELPLEENGDIFLSKVIDLTTKENLQNLMLCYSFYKKLYHF